LHNSIARAEDSPSYCNKKRDHPRHCRFSLANIDTLWVHLRTSSAMANNNETSVPKFGSFKPRRSAANPNTSRVDDTRGNGKQHELRLGNHRVEKPKADRTSRVDSYRPKTAHNIQHYSRDREDRHRDWRPINRDRKFPGNEVRGEIISRSEHDFYFVDTKGDLSNLQYRKFNKWTVPMYHLYGSGSIVGLDPDVKIDRKFNDQHSYTLMYPPKKAPSRAINHAEIAEPLEHAAVGDTGTTDAEPIESDEAQHAEADFVPLPFRQMQDDGQ
jgi:hypothetical protein